MSMKPPEVCTIDFETMPIDNRPVYPPYPVGLALRTPWQEPAYLAWGHTVENNSDIETAHQALDRIWDSGLPVLCHNAKFDLSIVYEKFGLPRLPWDRIHDSQFLAYLCDPHSRSLGLKQLAEDLLGVSPDEQDELRDWILERKQRILETFPQHREINKKTGKSINNIAPTKTGRWIFATPGDLCGRYAVGDVTRTDALFEHLWPIVQDVGMGEAYDRERQVLPIFMENEEMGIRVDMDELTRDTESYTADLDLVETALRHKLDAPDLNFDADRDLAAVLLKSDTVPEENWELTPSGQLSVAKDKLTPDKFTGPDGAQIASALGYRNRLKTCLSMFMGPWLEQAQKTSGYIHTNWNQIRGDQGGTRTGRPSTNNHNFLNISKTFEGRPDGYVHPDFLPVAELPLVRKYVIPDEGHVFQHRDFDGQELRVFAHGSQGALMRAYQEDPTTDPHEFVGKIMAPIAWDEEYNKDRHRTPVKGMNFKGIYGGGVPSIAMTLGVSLAEAKKFKKFHADALPDIQIFNEEIKRIVRRGDPIRTWGGRLYFPEEPKVVNGRRQDFIYKLINYWTQGSAADFTKDRLIAWHGACKTSRFLVTVYDELNISSPLDDAKPEMKILRDVMEEPGLLDVAMLSSGKRGPAWGKLEKCE